MKFKLILTLIILGLIFILGFLGVNYARRGQQVHEDISWLKKYKIAHRGLHDENKVENSMSAFKNAVDKKNAIELDVHLTKDEKIVVFHDDNLKRVTGLDKNIGDCTYDELKELKLGNSEDNIPLFGQVLELVKGEVPILIEVKNQGEVGKLEEVLYKELKNYKGEYAIQSFNPFVLSWFRENAPEVVRGQLSGTFEDEDIAWYKKFVLKNLLLNFKSKPAFIAYEINGMPKEFVTDEKGKGIILLGWTAKNKEEYDKGMEYFDNVIYEGFEIK
ncbi:glycerophosphodiester phosphodiesterase [Clostridium paraputrificum]|uniref:glycerophosphodiester phosphodiesterase n=1 Tax=Clostridium paraputrificum TaxID=29363 RepID=UPI003D32A3CE